MKLPRSAAHALGLALLLAAAPAWAGRTCDAEADIARAAAEAQQQGVSLYTLISVIEAQRAASKEARSDAKGSAALVYDYPDLSPDKVADEAYKSCLRNNGDDRDEPGAPAIAAALRARFSRDAIKK
jgi:hypothetical protein